MTKEIREQRDHFNAQLDEYRNRGEGKLWKEMALDQITAFDNHAHMVLRDVIEGFSDSGMGDKERSKLTWLLLETFYTYVMSKDYDK